MVLYLGTILICMVIIIISNIVFGTATFGYSWGQVIALVSFSVVAQIIIDLIIAGLTHALPEKLFNPNKKIFSVGRKERKFYEKLKIKSWKDKVLELGALGGFRKNKLKDKNDLEYLKLFMIENNKGILVHIFCIVFGCLVFLCIPLKYILVISLPVTIVNIILNTLPIMILRYNIPKLQVAYSRAERNQKTLQSGESLND